ncbi:hypothetical protein KDM87_14020 [Undibacterium sp. FT147W]|uniref:PH domain-containing protein n=1 Tax=Undibacterium rivi TaxID=2828729 RepID=A0ABS5H482_9BURK|nr:hypothetical protein [Undibacterium rivi]MBR7793711.1 hypothetical protein [Undibacterium rivi]
MQEVQTTTIFTRKKRQLIPIEKLAFFAFFISISCSLYWLFYLNLLDVEKLKMLFSQRHAERWLLFCLWGLFLIAYCLMRWSYRTARLIVDGHGIRLEQTSEFLLARLCFYQRNVCWSDLENVTYLERFDILQLRMGQKKLPWAIRVKDWQRQNFDTTLTVDGKEHALIHLLRERGVMDSFPPDKNLDAVMFDLAKHPATRALLVLMMALLAYIFIDAKLQTESWAFFSARYCLPHALTGVAAGVVVALWLFSSSRRLLIPSRVIVVMTLLSSMMFSVASYVGGIRINQMFGGVMLEAQYHRNMFCDALVPEEKNLPVIEYTNRARPYWCSRGEDDLILVRVRQGFFGLYQVDLREHSEAIRNFRQQH